MLMGAYPIADLVTAPSARGPLGPTQLWPQWTMPTAKPEQAATTAAGSELHTVAVLRANETNNLHSLAVQMRPVLECAGQVVFYFHNRMIAPDLLMVRERALEVVGDRLNADHYQTFRARTKGKVSPEELREVEAQEAAAAFVGAPKPKTRKGGRLNQADKVAMLQGGQEWCRYLSDHFSHGKVANWRGFRSEAASCRTTGLRMRSLSSA